MAAERIVKLFNEGNRVKTVLVVMDDSASSLAERLKGEDVTLLQIPDSDWHQKSEELASIIRAKEVKLIVLDDFALSLSDEIMESVGGEILRVSSPDLAPREVVNALEADLHRSEQPSEEKPEIKEDGAPSVESEWADALKIQFTPPKIPTTPPKLPGQDQVASEEIANDQIIEETPIKLEEVKMEEPLREERPWSRNPYYSQEHRDREGNSGPMPSTYLIWSILVTVFCCFIPGIIAIIFSSQVSSRYYAGDMEGARRASRMAEIWIIVSFVLGVLTATLYLPFMLIGG